MVGEGSPGSQATFVTKHLRVCALGEHLHAAGGAQHVEHTLGACRRALACFSD